MTKLDVEEKELKRRLQEDIPGKIGVEEPFEPCAT